MAIGVACLESPGMDARYKTDKYQQSVMGRNLKLRPNLFTANRFSLLYPNGRWLGVWFLETNDIAFVSASSGLPLQPVQMDGAIGQRDAQISIWGEFRMDGSRPSEFFQIRLGSLLVRHDHGWIRRRYFAFGDAQLHLALDGYWSYGCR